MNIPALLQECTAGGVSVFLAGGDIKLRGREEDVARLIPILRPYKTAILTYLLQPSSSHSLSPASQMPDWPGFASQDALSGEVNADTSRLPTGSPLTAEDVVRYQSQIAEAVRILRVHEGWSDEQVERILAASHRQPVYTLPPDAAALTAWADAATAESMAAAAIATAKGCCAECVNYGTVVTALKTRCLVARRQPAMPWRDWLDAADQLNECAYFERRRE